MSDHPYPGNTYLSGGAAQSEDSIIQQVCSRAQSYTSYPAPVIGQSRFLDNDGAHSILVTEFALTNPNTGADFLKTFYETQLSAFAHSGGAFFWSYNVAPASEHRVLALPAEQQVLYSYVDLAGRGNIVPTPSSAGLSSTAYLAELESRCSSVSDLVSKEVQWLSDCFSCPRQATCRASAKRGNGQ